MPQAGDRIPGVLCKVGMLRQETYGGPLAAGDHPQAAERTHQQRRDLEATRSRIGNSNGVIVKPVFSFPSGRHFHLTEPGGSEFAVWPDGNA